MGEGTVLDTSALISWPLSELSGSMIVSSQVSELEKHSPTRADIIESLGLIISEPSIESLATISELAMETGDMTGDGVVNLIDVYAFATMLSDGTISI